MAAHDPLPQTAGAFFLTDGGLETTLTFLEGIELPCFASFPLLLDPQGSAAAGALLRALSADRPRTARRVPPRHADLARQSRLGRETRVTTRRPSTGSTDEAVAWAKDMRDRHASPDTPVVINGIVGPRGDGYRPDAATSPEEAQAYHARSDRGLPGGRRRPRERDDPQHRRGGHRHHPRGAGRRPAGRHLVHRRDGRRARHRRGPAGGRLAGWTRRRAGDPPISWSTALTRPISRKPWPGAAGRRGSTASGRTRPPRATRSSTNRRSSTSATRPSWAGITGPCATAWGTCGCWADAAEPTIATSRPSRRPVSPEPAAFLRGATGSTSPENAL